MQEYSTFDILLDVRNHDINNINNTFRVLIPEKYQGKRLQVFVIELEAQFTADFPPPYTIYNNWPTGVSHGGASSARRPYNDIRLKLTDIKSDCFNITRQPLNVVAIAYGTATTNINANNCLFADYSLPDALYPILFEVNQPEFSFELVSPALFTYDVAIRRVSSPSTFISDDGSSQWNCKYFIIKFRFTVVN